MITSMSAGAMPTTQAPRQSVTPTTSANKTASQENSKKISFIEPASSSRRPTRSETLSTNGIKADGQESQMGSAIGSPASDAQSLLTPPEERRRQSSMDLLQLMFSLSQTPELSQALEQDMDTGHVNMDHLLKDCVIVVPEDGPSPGQVARKREKPRVVKRCTLRQLGKMGKRPLPLLKVGERETHAYSRWGTRPDLNEMLQRLNPQPKCELYNNWIPQKRIQQDNAFDAFTVEDLLFIHRNYPPGDLGAVLHFNEIGKRRVPPVVSVIEDSSDNSCV